MSNDEDKKTASGAAPCSAYTAGPWRLENDPCHYDSRTTVLAGDRRNPSMVVQVGGRVGLREVEANARLIAAAPELLEALEHILQETPWSELSEAACLRATEAISKTFPPRSGVSAVRQNAPVNPSDEPPTN